MKTSATYITILVGLLLALAALPACGAPVSSEIAPAASAPAPATAAPAAMQDSENVRAARVAAAPAAPAAAAAPQPPDAMAAQVIKEAEVEVVEETAVEAMSSEGSELGEFDEERAALVAQNRIIVRTVNMELEVHNVSDAIETISHNAQQDGGWVVSTDRSTKHYGFIAVRIPAKNLDSSLEWMRQLGIDVLSETSTSTDVTDEYYDLRSRVTSLQATEEALIKLLDRAEDVEDALEVQRELARLQVEVEAHLGRIKLLEETAAFSLVNISLNLAPQEMRVDAGEDRTYSVGEGGRFRAIFYPPEGIDDFDFTWDFGDGTKVVTGTGSAPRPNGGRITATAHHQYSSDLESPFIVEVKMNGRGEAGIVEGSDTFIATVTELPAITVFAGEHRFVEAGETIEFSGSFTRPEGLTNYQYSWEFGDGSEAVTVTPEQGATTVIAAHVYDNHRPQPYTVNLTVTGESEAGQVKGAASFEVFVQEAEGFVIAGWSAGDNMKDAARALSGFAQVAGTVAIWVVIFVPVWLILGGVIYGIVIFRRRLVSNARKRAPADSGVDEGYVSSARQENREAQDWT